MKSTIFAIVTLLALTACNGGHGIVNNVDGQQAVISALPTGDAAKATIKGNLTLNGLTPTGPVGSPIGDGVMGKIIDPNEDILSTTPITPGTEFQLSADKAVKGDLQFEVTVAEDVNGDGVTPDNVVAAVPVNLVLGRVATVNLTITRGVKPASPAEGGPGTAEDVFYPDPALGNNASLLLLDLTQSDAGGSKSDFYAVTPGGSAIFDADGDKFIEAGDDTQYADTDRNGWPDASQAALDSTAATALSLTGTVSGVDRVVRTLTLQDAAGNSTTITVDPFASILPLSAQGTLLGSLLLDQSLVGRDVQVYGVKGGAENRASLIVVQPVK